MASKNERSIAALEEVQARMAEFSAWYGNATSQVVAESSPAVRRLIIEGGRLLGLAHEAVATAERVAKMTPEELCAYLGVESE